MGGGRRNVADQAQTLVCVLPTLVSGGYHFVSRGVRASEVISISGLFYEVSCKRGGSRGSV